MKRFFAGRQADRLRETCDCRVAFATENLDLKSSGNPDSPC